MRPIYSALGEIAGCAIAGGDDIVQVIRRYDPVELGLTIDTDGQWIQFLAEPHHEFITVMANYQLSAFDHYPIDRYISETEGTEAAKEAISDEDFPHLDIQILRFVPEEEEEEYFDGIHVRSKVYPFENDEGMALSEYIEVRDDLRYFTPTIFNDTLEQLGYDLEEIHSAGSQGDIEMGQSEDSPAFQ